MNELEYQKLHKNAKKCMRLAAWTGVLITLLVLAAVWFVMVIQEIMPFYGHILCAAAAAGLLIYAIAAPAIRYRRYRYYIDSEQVIVVEGLWFITREIAPVERIHQITVKSGPYDRLYGLAKVIATTAGGTITIRFLEIELAETIAQSLQSQIREIIGEQQAEDEVERNG